ncbi:MAG: host attachment protein [Hyphomicrobiales bacterium]
MKAKVTWILVADGARARILARRGGDGALVQIPDGAFTNVVRRVSELGTDRPGRVHESANAARHAVTPRVDWRHEEKRSFAHRLGEFLEQNSLRKAFDHLVLVAAPQFLGDLRGSIGEETRKRLTGELDKDLTKLPLDEIQSHLISAHLL